MEAILAFMAINATFWAIGFWMGRRVQETEPHPGNL